MSKVRVKRWHAWKHAAGWVKVFVSSPFYIFSAQTQLNSYGVFLEFVEQRLKVYYKRIINCCFKMAGMTKITQVQITWKFIFRDTREKTALSENTDFAWVVVHGKVIANLFFTIVVNIYRYENAVAFRGKQYTSTTFFLDWSFFKFLSLNWVISITLND